MGESTLLSTLVIMFRETLEAGLIVGIIFAMLARLQALRYARVVWGSIAAAVAASVAVGWALSLSTAVAQDQWKTIIEGLLSLAACGVLTYMVFWMDRQAKAIRPHLETEVEAAVAQQALPAMITLPFLAVFREGAESALFLNAVALQSGAPVSALGGLLGAGLAVAITAMIFVGGRRVPLKALFRSTGWLLLLIAAGLLAYGLHELQEIGWVPTLIDHVWDINHLLNEKQGVGALLKSLFGYNGNPSLLEVIAYVAYLAGVSWALRRTARPPAPPAGPQDGPPIKLTVAGAAL